MSRADEFDAWTRQMHHEAVARLSPQALAHIRAARHAAVASAPTPAARRGFGWLALAATGCAVTLAIALGLRMQPAPAPEAVPQAIVPVTPPATTTPLYGDLDLIATLGEDPDLYLWMASAEAKSLAME